MDRPSGLTLLSSHGESGKLRSDQVEVDIVFVHGLGAHPTATWSQQNPPAIPWLGSSPSPFPSGRGINAYGYSWNSTAALQTSTAMLEAGDALLADVYKLMDGRNQVFSLLSIFFYFTSNKHRLELRFL